MSEEVKSFVDKLAAGDNAGAGEAFNSIILQILFLSDCQFPT